MTRRKILLLGGVAVASHFALTGSAIAADAASTASPAPDATVGELVVTAFKREVSVQQIPASISAVSGEALAQKGVEDVRDLSKVVPNLNWGEHFGTTIITIRGVGSNVDSGVTEPTVAMYVDGVYLPRSDMSTLRAVDLDRVEVVRGPQGTLYGRNATGGAINFISQGPTDTFKAGVNLSAGSRNAWGVNGYVSGPLSSGVSMRISGGHDSQDGYVKVENTGQRLNGIDDTFVRGALRLEPSSDVKVDLSVRYDINKAANAYQQLLEPSFLAGPSGQTTVPNRIIANYPFSGRNKTLVVAGAVNWTISDHLKLKSLSAYVDHVSDYAVDDDSTSTPYYHSDTFHRPSRSYSEELNLFGDYERVTWILGAFYFHEDASGLLPVQFEAAAGPLNGTAIHLGQSSKINNFALFGDVTYSLTSRLRLNVGLRYNHEDNTYGEQFSFVGVLPSNSGTFKTKTDKFLPKVALQYDLTDDVNAYAQWSLGYKSGGANLPDGGSGALLPLYGPENLSAFEVGLKSQLFDRRITANVAAFYYNYRGLQITTNIPPAATLVENAHARVYGIEGEFKWNVTDRFSLEVAPTLMHARFVNFVSLDPVFLISVNLDGKPLERAPDFTVNAGGQYRIDLGQHWLSTLTLQANMLYSSRVVLRYYDDAPGQAQGAYAVGNLSATVADQGEMTKLTVFLNNVSNTHYKQQVTNFGLGNMGNYGPPRTFGVRLSRRF